jgi:hypothetical protein
VIELVGVRLHGQCDQAHEGESNRKDPHAGILLAASLMNHEPCAHNEFIGCMPASASTADRQMVQVKE